MDKSNNPLYISPTEIKVTAKDSLVHVGSLDSFDITKGGIKAGKLMLSYFENGNKKNLFKAIEIYEKIIPDENFGGEYTALEWICKLLTSPDEAQKDLLSQPLVKSFYDVLSKDNFKDLRQYLQLKYHIVEIDKNDIETKKKLRFLEDFILFNNPDRERWEKTRENLEKNAVRDADIAFDNAVMEAIIAKVDVPIPNCMYEHRIDDLVRNFENMLSQQGMSLDLYLQYTGMDMTDFHEQNYDRAVSEVKLRLALEKIAELEKIQITDEEVDESLKGLAESSHLPLAEVKRRLPMEDYITDMRVTKALEIVKENADTTEDAAAPAEESAE